MSKMSVCIMYACNFDPSISATSSGNALEWRGLIRKNRVNKDSRDHRKGSDEVRGSENAGGALRKYGRPAKPVYFIAPGSRGLL